MDILNCFPLEKTVYLLDKQCHFEQQIQKCIEEVLSDSRTVYLTLNYDFTARYVARQFYENGLLLKYFHVEDVRRWNVMLTHVDGGAEKYVTDCVENWLKQHKPDPSDVMIYSCGPEPMLKSVAELATAHNIECQLNVALARAGCNKP